MREYQQAFQKFSVLRRGHYVYPDEFITLVTLMNATTSQHNEKEWGFPKGRRNINEKDIKCALREFQEETGIDTRDVHVHTYVKPFEEVFTACNKVRYCHVYYIVQLKQDTDADITKSNTDIVLKGEKSQMREISRVSWLDEQTVKNKINVDHVERRDMFDRVHDLIMTSQFLQALKLPWIARSDVVPIPPHVARPPPPPPKTRLRDGVNRDDNDSDTQNINHQISDII
jgi:8-oxo-dGTP pyrophosphatase MutT (NUDIX family)